MKKISIAFLAAMSLASFGCKKKGGAGEAMAKMGEFKDKMCACKDTGCAQKVSEEMTKWSQDMAKDMKDPPKMSEEDAKKSAEVAKEMGDCMQKAMTPGGDKPADGSAAAGSGDKPADKPADGSAAPAAAGGGDLPAECAEYKAAIEKLSTCDKLPQAARDALKQSYEQTSAAWASVPAEGKAALGTACKAAADAVKQSSAACN